MLFGGCVKAVRFATKGLVLLWTLYLVLIYHLIMNLQMEKIEIWASMLKDKAALSP